MRSFDIHLKSRNLNFETCNLKTSVLRNSWKILLFITMKSLRKFEVKSFKPSWDICYKLLWEGISFELRGRNAFQNKTLIPRESNFGRNTNSNITEFQVTDLRTPAVERNHFIANILAKRYFTTTSLLNFI